MINEKNRLVKRFERMAAQRNQVFADLSKVSIANQSKAPEGSWSSLEILQHLYLSESGVLKLLQKQILKPASDFHDEIFRNIYRSWALNLSLLSTLRYKAPASVSHFERRMELEELQDEWKIFESMMQLLVNEFPESHAKKVIFRHPRAGWLSMKGTLNFLRFHQLHHMRQIRERAGVKS